MKPIPLVCFVALAALLAPAPACINVSGVSMDGKIIEENVAGELTRDALASMGKKKEYWQGRLVVLEKKMAKKPTLRDRSDYGGVLAHLGQFEKARKVLEAAEAAKPGDYAVASNLGTTYELLGDNAKALEWIKKGMERSPESHAGTEWVHVKILEAKLALATDPQWLESHSVLGVDYGTEPRPAMAAEKTRKDNWEVAQGAWYQLAERLQFVQAPDPLVGDLLFELGNALAIAEAVDAAVGIYELAQEYHSPHAELLTQRIAFMRDALAKAGVSTDKTSKADKTARKKTVKK